MRGSSSFGPLSGSNIIAGLTVSDRSNVTINYNHTDATPGKPCHVIPLPRNPGIVGRLALFARLDELLPPNSASHHSAALWGLGGSGKTQIALEYAYRRCQDRDPECSVLWVNADTETTFAQDYETIAARFGLAAALKGEELLTAVRDRIATESRWFLVLDNADNLMSFGVGRSARSSTAGKVADLYEYVPKGPSGMVLWTSRDKRIVGTRVPVANGIHVTEMTADEATTLLERTRDGDIRDVETEDAQKLLNELQCLPLAISQVGSYLRRTSTSVGNYLSRLYQGKKQWKALEEMQFDLYQKPGGLKNLLETWVISIEYLQIENPLACKTLHIICYLDNQNIPYDVISEVAFFDAAGQECGKGKNEDDVAEAIARLVELSFISPCSGQEDAPNYEMHKLIQWATQHNLAKNGASEQLRSAESALDIMLKLFPSSSQGNWARCEAYLPHALQVCERDDIQCDKEKIANLLTKISGYLDSRGRWREKEVVDKKSYELTRETLGEVHPDTWRCLKSLGDTYFWQGRWKEAKEVFERILVWEKDSLGENHRDTLQTSVNIAATCYTRGLLAEAEPLFSDLLKRRQEHLGKKDPKTLESIGDLAATFHAQGKWSDAKDHYMRLIELREEVLGPDHHKTNQSRADLASTYHEQGQWVQAETWIKKAVDGYQAVLGEDHPDTLWARKKLALIQHAQGRWKEAEVILRQVLGQETNLLGSRHPSTIITMAHLATAIHEQGAHDESEKLYSEVLDLRISVLGEQHPETLQSMSDTAAAYQRRGQWSTARERHARVYALRRKVLGEEHPGTLQSMADLASAYHGQGAFKKDQELSEKVLTSRKKVLGPDHPDTLRSMADLATTHFAQGRFRSAETLYRDALGRQKETLGDDHPDTMKGMASLAAACFAQSKFEDDKKLSEDVVAARKRVFGDDHPDTLQSMEDLAQTYAALGRRKDSRRLVAEVRAKRRRLE